MSQARPRAARRRASGLYAFLQSAPLHTCATAVARADARALLCHRDGPAAGVARRNPIHHMPARWGGATSPRQSHSGVA
eukprot:scaffold9532_cov74-Phaeocystis_antarctica.AAC.2